MTRNEEIQQSVKTLYRVWTYQSGGSQFCGDLLRAVHRGEGAVEFRDLSVLDHPAFNAALSLMINARTPLPIDGLRSFLSERQFAALFEIEAELESSPEL